MLNKPNFDIFEKIDLKLEVIPKDPSGGKTGKRLGESYESCNIFATYYSKYSLPDNDKLFSDLLAFIKIYEEIINKHEQLDSYDNHTISKDVWFEDLTKYSIHRRIERNQTLCKKAKEIHGYICQACNFNFEEQYGEVGKNFIEAHHKIPISNLEKTKIALDPSRNFMVLCSNCHRMIHRIKPIPSLEEFKRIIKI